jgi:hypothetical protein
MKKNRIILTMIIGMIIFVSTKVNGQVSVPNNIAGGTNYLGWDNTVNVPLNIKHEANRPIHFYTNAGNGTFNNRKMSIMRRTINGIERAGVGIHERGANPITFPRSILHLGNNFACGWCFSTNHDKLH